MLVRSGGAGRRGEGAGGDGWEGRGSGLGWDAVAWNGVDTEQDMLTPSPTLSVPACVRTKLMMGSSTLELSPKSTAATYRAAREWKAISVT